MKNKNNIYLVYKKHTSGLTQAESDQLDTWLKGSSENKKNAYLLISQLEEMNQSSLPEFDQKSVVWQRIQREMKSKFERKSVIPDFRISPAWAVALLVICLGGYGLFKMVLNPWHIVQTVRGEQKQVLLADGSTIELNYESRIKYLKSFRTKNRDVYLQGEAFFSVEPDSLPFVVKTDQAVCTVTGTEFNVQARSQRTDLSVEEGQVQFRNKLSKDSMYTVQVNQKSTIIDEEFPTQPKPADLKFLTGWRTGKLYFIKLQVPAVIDELERYYNIHIEVERLSLQDKTVTATIYQLSAEQAVGSICQTLGIQYRIKGKTYIIYGK